MNWLHILSVLVLLWAIWWVVAYSNNHYDWFIPPAFIGGMIMIFSVIPLSILADHRVYKESQVQFSGELVSLENSQSVSGSISGGGGFLAHSIMGSIEGVTKCSFVVQQGDRIIIIDSNVRDIIFHPTDGEVFKVEKRVSVYYEPYSLGEKNKVYWENDYFNWHITIPKSSINKYIRFN